MRVSVHVSQLPIVVRLEEPVPWLVPPSHHWGGARFLLEAGSVAVSSQLSKWTLPAVIYLERLPDSWVVSPPPSIRLHPPLPYIHALLVQFPFLSPEVLTAAFITGVSVERPGSSFSLQKRTEVQRQLLFWRTGEHPLIARLVVAFFPPRIRAAQGDGMVHGRGTNGDLKGTPFNCSFRVDGVKLRLSGWVKTESNIFQHWYHTGAGVYAPSSCCWTSAAKKKNKKIDEPLCKVQILVAFENFDFTVTSTATWFSVQCGFSNKVPKLFWSPLKQTLDHGYLFAVFLSYQSHCTPHTVLIKKEFSFWSQTSVGKVWSRCHTKSERMCYDCGHRGGMFVWVLFFGCVIYGRTT